MAEFSIGDRLRVRFGERQAEVCEVMDIQPARVYKVIFADGVVLFYSQLGLEPERKDLVMAGR
jgi:hypothetical protein